MTCRHEAKVTEHSARETQYIRKLDHLTLLGDSLAYRVLYMYATYFTPNTDDYRSHSHPQITLDREEWFDVTPRHRLGILNEIEPVPILYGVINQPMVVISAGRFAGGVDSLSLGSVQTFDELEFPYRFALDVCNASGASCIHYILLYITTKHVEVEQHFHTFH